MTQKIRILLDIWNNREGYQPLLEISELISFVDLPELIKLDSDTFRTAVDTILDDACKELKHNLRSYFYIKKDF